jgi:hypothetical protein
MANIIIGIAGECGLSEFMGTMTYCGGLGFTQFPFNKAASPH